MHYYIMWFVHVLIGDGGGSAGIFCIWLFVGLLFNNRTIPPFFRCRGWFSILLPHRANAAALAFFVDPFVHQFVNSILHMPWLGWAALTQLPRRLLITSHERMARTRGTERILVLR